MKAQKGEEKTFMMKYSKETGKQKDRHKLGQVKRGFWITLNSVKGEEIFQKTRLSFGGDLGLYSQTQSRVDQSLVVTTLFFGVMCRNVVECVRRATTALRIPAQKDSQKDKAPYCFRVFTFELDLDLHRLFLFFAVYCDS